MIHRSALALVALSIACGGNSVSPSTAPSATPLSVSIPEGFDSSGILFVIELSAEDVESNLLQDVSRFDALLRHVEVLGEVSAIDGLIAVPFQPASSTVAVRVVYDSVGVGMDALFGMQPGLAAATWLPAEGRALSLEGEPFTGAPEEPCIGDRLELIAIDAPETRRQGDPGQRRLCVYLPASYAASPERRYPVLFAFPGYSGSHVHGNAFRARARLDAISAETGIEVLFVGVETNMPEGPSYLDSSERFGDWDHYVSEHVPAVLDERFRTLSARGAIGHSTGGLNALNLALRHPDVVQTAAASSPDAPDLDVWMFDESGAVRPWIREWLRVEYALGNRGQMISYAANWSPDPSAPHGYRWPVDPASGALERDVFARWRVRSPAADLATPEGLARAQRLSGRLLITTGRADEFGLFEPSEHYAAQLTEAGIEVRFIPTPWGHFDHEERLDEPFRFLLARLAR